MINRTFEGYKFNRTYIGGSKEKEQELFLKVQGTKEDNSECDWYEYRRMLVHYFDDVLHTILSWKIIFSKISVGLIIFSILLSFFSLTISVISILLSLFFQVLFQIFKKREVEKLKEYDFCLTVVLGEIKEKTGLTIPKN